MEQLEQTQILHIQNVWAAQQILPKSSFECSDGKTMYTFHGIIYSEKHNGTVLLMYEARTKQLPSPPSNFGLNNYSNPKHPWGLLTLQQIF